MEITRQQNHTAAHRTDSSMLDTLKSYLGAAEPKAGACVVSLQAMLSSSRPLDECKEVLANTLHCEVAADK
jgi:hypothetical protein